jgi:hypothetical protein
MDNSIPVKHDCPACGADCTCQEPNISCLHFLELECTEFDPELDDVIVNSNEKDDES